MSEFFEVGKIDKLEVTSEVIPIEATVEQVTVRSEYQQLGEISRYALVPFNAASRTKYDLPENVIGSLKDIWDIRDSLADKLGRTELALEQDAYYTDRTGYTLADGTLREQALAEMDVRYLSNGPEGEAAIMKFNFNSASISSYFDDNGNMVYESANLVDMRNDIVSTKAGQASVTEVQEVISNWDNSTATKVTKLEADYGKLSVDVEDKAYAFAGTGTVRVWDSRNALNPEGWKEARGGDLSYNPNETKWYIYAGGTLGPLKDGWMVYEGSTIEDAAKASARYFDSANPPPEISLRKLYDVWMVVEDGVPVMKQWVFNTVTGAPYWETVPEGKPAASHLGGFSRLIRGENGVTGYSIAGGGVSAFKINADSFEVSNAADTYTPFKIESDGVHFKGKVTLAGLDINSDTTKIHGDLIESGVIKSNTVTPTGRVSEYDLNNGKIVIRDNSGQVRVKLGKLT
jgi:hypothetical protein